jgi:hypothetical protein
MDEHHDRLEGAYERRESVLDYVRDDGHLIYICSAVVLGGEAPSPLRLLTRIRVLPAPAAVGLSVGPEHSLSLDRIVTAVAQWIASEQAPPREHQASKYAVPPDRIDRVS